MTKYIFHVHSFVDLITNSSSELFVCDSIKTEEVIKNVVELIVGDWDYYEFRLEKVDEKLAKSYLDWNETKLPVGAFLLTVEYGSMPDKLEKKLKEVLNLKDLGEYYVGY